MLRLEIFRLLKSRIVFLCVILGSLICIISGIASYNYTIYFINASGHPEEISAIEAFTYCLTMSGGLYRIILPLLISPFLLNFISERQCGYYNFIISREKYSKYFKTMYIVGVLSAAIIAIAILVFTMIVCVIVYPLNEPRALSVEYIQYDWMKALYSNHQLVFFIMVVASTAFYAVAYYSIGFGISLYIKNKYIVVLTPFAIHMVLTILTSVLNCSPLTPVMFLTPFDLGGLTTTGVILSFSITALVAALLVWNYYVHDRKALF